MSEFSIRVDRLSKQYQSGPREHQLTLRDRLSAAVRRPWRSAPARPPVWALRDVSFDVRQGDVLGVIGANGAGKSTLMKILARVTDPTSGRAEVRGRIGSLLEVGTGFHQELTGRENVFMSGAVLGMSRAEIARRFDEIVEFSGVERFIDTPVKQYSSGMYIRLGFAVAAHLDVDTLVVDEALAVGDVAFQRKCLGRMAGVASEGRTVLFVSHDLAAIGSLTRTAVCLDAGRIVAHGSTSQVVREYLSRAAGRGNENGFVSLSAQGRPDSVAASEAVRLEWVRTRGESGTQSASFDEGEPIAVEFGFTVLKNVGTLEFVFGVATMPQGVVLFMVPSPKYRAPVGRGTYTLGLRIDPNYLRAGNYSLGFKVIADGLRADTLHDALRFGVMEAVEAGAAGDYRRWDGLMRFEYDWTAMARTSAFGHESSYTSAVRRKHEREEVGSLT